MHIYTFDKLYIHIYTLYIYVCVCVCTYIFPPKRIYWSVKVWECGLHIDPPLTNRHAGFIFVHVGHTAFLLSSVLLHDFWLLLDTVDAKSRLHLSDSDNLRLPLGCVHSLSGFIHMTAYFNGSPR